MTTELDNGIPVYLIIENGKIIGYEISPMLPDLTEEQIKQLIRKHEDGHTKREH